MKKTNVTSSNIDSIGYDEKSKTLEIEFKKGGIYQYSNVPKELFTSLMKASSHGRFFHAKIKDRFPTTKVK
jgi:hypothetical protein